MTMPPLPRTLAVLTAVMAAGEVISSVIIWREAYPDSQPLFALLFAALFGLATWLVLAGRLVGGAALAEVLFLFEVGTAPTWQRRSALDWSSQLVCGSVALVGLVVAATVLVTRLRSTRARAR